ncbi:citramalate synthase [Schaalia vaccimaxillae]|uniref:citramalate synthase n=1 Tax=Schaalia vaccimaxillae TaxID=183916 RepID=UPI0003B6DFC6|nr:citramalate synthase [Schaalia vaccimaxillae]
MAEHVALYDTTLRDGAQQEGISLSVADKLAALPILDELGVDYIEGGWPGAIPKDTVFFERASRVTLENAKLVAFGATAKAGVPADQDPQVLALLGSGAPAVALVAKADPRHVTRALRTTLDENLRMVRDTVEFLTAEGIEVMVDLEHYFDGLEADPKYSLDVLLEAARAGARAVIPCDTNGGNLPSQIGQWVGQARSALDETGCTQTVLGIHTHNDTGCAVANAVAAVENGARQVQGTVNGYGERTGNANLLTCAANLQLKLGYDVISEDSLSLLDSVSRRIGEIVNISPFAREPYVGSSAFAHKAGLHASAIRIDPDLYQHIDPSLVGNGMRMLVSEMAGKSSIELKAQELGLDLSHTPDAAKRLASRVKEREAQGYTYDAADASFELLALEELGRLPRFVRVESWKVTSQEIAEVQGEPFTQTEATVKIHTDRRHIRTAEGNGPVHALDRALRHVMTRDYPVCANFELTDFKVRILDEERGGTDASIRVLIQTTDGKKTWNTVGIGTDVIEASWEALFEAYWWGLLHSGAQPLLRE